MLSTKHFMETVPTASQKCLKNGYTKSIHCLLGIPYVMLSSLLRLDMESWPDDSLISKQLIIQLTLFKVFFL